MTLRALLFTGALAFGAPAAAQTAVPHQHGAATPTAGQMTAAEVGVEPMTGVTAASYAEFASDSNRFEVISAEIAMERSRRSEIKAFAKMVKEDHDAAQASLRAALTSPNRRIAEPPKQLSNDNSAQVEALKAAKSNFDALYVTQQIDAHKKAWSLHKGYAENGEDTTLKQLAATQVPAIERHLKQLQALQTETVAAR